MATFNASIADIAVDMLDFGTIDFAGQDPAGPNNATNYSWLTSDGHDIQATGNNISFNNDPPTSGNVNTLFIDLQNDGDTDVTVTGLNGASLVGMTGGALNFLNTVLGGDDTLIGSSSADILKGAGGNDSINGGGGNDSLLGGAGSDTLRGGNGHDELSGGAGNDFLIEDSGNDTLLGGSGDDFLQVTGSAIALDRYHGGNGNDTIDFSSVALSQGSIIDINGGVIQDGVGGGQEQLIGVENVFGSGSGDFIIGSSGANLLKGMGGDDTINAGGGNDSLQGGGGSDVLKGAGGNDSIHGGNQGDTLSGGDGNDTLDGGNGNDSLSGGDGNDRLIEGAGTDSLTGGAGHDFIVVTDASIANDGYRGGPGSDTISFNEVTLNSGTTIDLAAGSIVDGVTAGSEVIETIEHVIGSQGNETIAGTGGGNVLKGAGGADHIIGRGGDDALGGGGGRDTLTGGAGNDSIAGDAGRDSLVGGSGDDILFGGVGPDTLRGGSGNDTLVGGEGDDTLFGNGGADIFTFDVGDGHDTVSDFQDGTDLLDFTDFNFASANEARQLATNQGGDVLFDFGGGDTLLVENITKAQLTGADFII